MGGSGSGRWHAHWKATTVEECRLLDLGELARDGAFTPWHAGTVRWFRGERETASIGYTVRPAASGLVLVVSYRWVTAGDTTEEAVELPVRLETTRLHSGGVRWWGRCPLVVNGRDCGRRVAKLYLPPGGRYFGCRACHRLTYQSAQEHDKRVDLLVRNPQALAAIVENPQAARDGSLILAIKATGRVLGKLRRGRP